MVLDKHLKKCSLWRKSQPRDGNSIFRAIAELLFNSQITYTKVKNYYFDFIHRYPKQFKQMCERMLPFFVSCYDNQSNKLTINLSVLSQLFLINFQIYHDGCSVQTVPSMFRYDHDLKLARLEEDHFDILYADVYRDNLAYVQSLFYTILYKHVFQIDIPFNKKNFTLQTVREPYFLTQDAYEFSHLERCFNILYFENISLTLWKSEFSSDLISNVSGLPDIKVTYSLGDEVRVYSPNTENKPYYLGKIINLNVTPGMHEVLASNRGTEIVDIGHLQPVFDEDESSNFSSQTQLINTERPSMPLDKHVMLLDSVDSHGEVASFQCQSNKLHNSDSKFAQFSKSTFLPTSSSITELKNMEIGSKSIQAPPGFEEEVNIQEVQQISESNCSKTFTSTSSLTIQGPKHKYGPQSAVVKQKYQYEHNSKDPDSTLVMKPFEQIYETAHSQIKKLQFKLNNSPEFLSPKFSIHPEGSDLPDDKFILQYFYNLGVQYQLMRSHGSSWKDVLPNSCPPLYHDNNYHAGNQMMPFMFRDTPGLYFSQDMVVPNYFYDMAMMPIIQGYGPPLTYNMQGEPFMVQNYGKHFKEESDSEKMQSLNKQDNIYDNEEHQADRSSTNSLFKSKSEIDPSFSNPGVDKFEVSPFDLMKKPLDDIQNDPTSWPQPGGDKNDISWLNNDIIENQNAAYSNALKKGTPNKQPSYTAERTIYASNSGCTSIAKSTLAKRNSSNSQNAHLNSYANRKT